MMSENLKRKIKQLGIASFFFFFVKGLLWIGVFLGIGKCVNGQESPIFLDNPSFEDLPRHSTPPKGWFYCGKGRESPPDVHPSGAFQVTQSAFHGSTYVGMVVRDDNSWEGLGQKLPQPLTANQCYRFSLFLAISDHYVSISQLNRQIANFDQPVRLLLWGGDYNCHRGEMLASSKAVVNTEWEEFIFDINPKNDYTHFFIEAYYAKGRLSAYNGNILVDKASPFIPMDCENNEPSSRLREVRIPDIKNTAELKSYLAQKSEHLRFEPSRIRLETHLFRDADGNTHQSNKYLWQVFKALGDQPEYGLVIGIRETNSRIFREKKTLIARQLTEMRIIPESYKIVQVRKAGNKKKWLGGQEGSEVFFRLKTKRKRRKK